MHSADGEQIVSVARVVDGNVSLGTSDMSLAATSLPLLGEREEVRSIAKTSIGGLIQDKDVVSTGSTIVLGQEEIMFVGAEGGS